MKIVCGWCQADLGEKYPEQPGITHGICSECKAKVLAERNSQDVLTPEDGAEVSPPSPLTPRPLFHRKVKCK